MVKMFIELNENKIKEEKIYNLEKLWAHLDARFANFGGYRDETGWYTNGTFESFGAIMANLEEEEWFMDNVKTWLWRNTDYEEVPEDLYIEDILESMSERGEYVKKNTSSN